MTTTTSHFARIAALLAVSVAGLMIWGVSSAQAFFPGGPEFSEESCGTPCPVEVELFP